MNAWDWLVFGFGCAFVTATVLVLITAGVGYVAARLWGEVPKNNAHRRA